MSICHIPAESDWNKRFLNLTSPGNATSFFNRVSESTSRIEANPTRELNGIFGTETDDTNNQPCLLKESVRHGATM
jgi:hypothetical protein